MRKSEVKLPTCAERISSALRMEVSNWSLGRHQVVAKTA
jgi:hypothetical protein